MDFVTHQFWAPRNLKKLPPKVVTEPVPPKQDTDDEEKRLGSIQLCHALGFDIWCASNVWPACGRTSENPWASPSKGSTKESFGGWWWAKAQEKWKQISRKKQALQDFSFFRLYISYSIWCYKLFVTGLDVLQLMQNSVRQCWHYWNYCFFTVHWLHDLDSSGCGILSWVLHALEDWQEPRARWSGIEACCFQKPQPKSSEKSFTSKIPKQTKQIARKEAR